MKTEVGPRPTVTYAAVAHRSALPPRLELIAVAAIVGIGAYLRFADLEFAQFRPDDAALLNIARGLVEHPQVLSSGIPSSAAGFVNGPFQAYLLLPAVLLSRDPLAAYYLVAALNLAGILLFWSFARSFWGQYVALAAVLLYAVNPWAVVFSRRLWGNDLTAPFLVLLIWSLCSMITRGRRRDSVMPWVWLAVLIQLYVGALVHIALFGIALIVGRRKVRPAFLSVGAALFLILTGPYLLGVLIRNLDSIATPMGSLSAPAKIDLTSLLFMLHTVSAEGYQAFANNAGALVDASVGLPKLTGLASEALLIVGLTVAFLMVARRRSVADAGPVVLAATAVSLPAILLIRHSATVYVYYLLVGFPMHFLLLALGLKEVFRWVREIARKAATRRGQDAIHSVRIYDRLACSAVALLPAAIVAVNLALAPTFFKAIHEFWPQSDYGVPLRYTLDVVDQIKRVAREQDVSRVLIGGAENQEGVLLGMLAPDFADLTFFDSDRSFVIPSPDGGRVLYLVPTTEDPIGRDMAQALGDARVASVDLPGFGWRYGLFVLGGGELARAAALPSATPPKSHNARLGNYLELLGYSLPAEVGQDGRLRVALYWKVLKRPAQNISLFSHLIGSRGSLWAQYDGLSYPTEQWQPGDIFVERHELSMPAGAPAAEYQVEAGAYYTASGERLTAVVGTDHDDRVRLGSMRVARSSSRSAPTPAEHDIRFGDAIALRDYRLDGPAVAGQQLRVTLFWESVAAVEDDYTVFVHLAGADGKPIAQADGPPAFGMLPTSAWLPGDFLRDAHEMTLPRNLKPGRYRLLVGLYRPSDGSRLVAKNQTGSALDRMTVLLGQRGLWPASPRVVGDSVELTRPDVRLP